MKQTLLSGVLLLLCFSTTTAQINFTARDSVRPYNGDFRYGTNAGYFPPFNTSNIIDLAAGNPNTGVMGAGCKTIRFALIDEYLTNYGLSAEIANCQRMVSLGMMDNVAFVGYPHPSKRDSRQLTCPGGNRTANMFQNLYQPIWDGGLNGTPVNENNPYALYLWNVVNAYKPYIKYWEIYNEPDFEGGCCGWKGPQDPTSWWNRSNIHCDVQHNFIGTIYEYIRVLRISWEVIKYIDPSLYVCTGGIGYEAYLDALLRYTDNPVDGSVSPQYPYDGGAYFDILSYHVYPQYEPETNYWGGSGMVYQRNSDGSAASIIGQKNRFQDVLDDYGYNGITYRKKRFIATEHNIASLAFGNHVGGPDVQRNYQIKCQILSQLNGVEQLHVYGLAEVATQATATGSFDVMGLYYKLNSGQPLSNQALTQSGWANLSLSALMFGKKPDMAQTQAMNLPANVAGGAFRDPNGQYTYVLWAKTTTDRSEAASATYSFPPSFGISTLARREWNYMQSAITTMANPASVSLSGTPVFLTASGTLPVEWGQFQATAEPDGAVRLNWQTLNEQANALFTVERSADGDLFQPVVEQTSQGAGNTLRNYEAFDYTPLQGMNYYRIKQTDIDGQTGYSSVVQLWFEAKSAMRLAVSPNPAREFATLHYEAPADVPASLELQDLNGRLIRKIPVQQQAGAVQTQLELKGLNPGVYYIVLQSGPYRKTEKLVVTP